MKSIASVLILGLFVLGCSKVEVTAPGVNVKVGPGGVSVKAPGADVKVGADGVKVDAGKVDPSGDKKKE